MAEIYYSNGEYVEKADAQISVDSRGFRFGDGIFETMRVIGERVWQWEFHYKRLYSGCHKLMLTPPDQSTLEEIIAEVITRNAIAEGMLRLSYSRGGESAGYLPIEPNAQPILVVQPAHLPEAPSESVALWRSDIAIPSAAMQPWSRSKTMQGLPSTLARLQATEQGCFEALLLNEKDEIAETSSGNIFWYRDGAWHTPSLASGAVEGSIRHILCTSVSIYEGDYTLQNLLNAEEVCITNAAWLVLPVKSLEPDGMMWYPSNATKALQERAQEALYVHA